MELWILHIDHSRLIENKTTGIVEKSTGLPIRLGFYHRMEIRVKFMLKNGHDLCTCSYYIWVSFLWDLRLLAFLGL